jgi:hypothetical protein
MASSRLIRRWNWVSAICLVASGPGLAVSQTPEPLPPPTQVQDAGKARVLPSPPTAEQLPVPIGTEDLPDGRSKPGVLGRPTESTPSPQGLVPPPDFEPFLQADVDPPLGFAGPSGVRPRDIQRDADFIPMEDRWRIGFPEWDRYGKGHPPVDDYPYVLGRWWDPFNQNVLKGDYAIIGQNTFLNLTATSRAVIEGRQLPTPENAFDSTARPFGEEVFGRPNQFFYTHQFILSVDLFHGDASFKPVDWRVKVTPIFDINYLAVDEVGIVSPNVLEGTTRGRTWLSLEEWFVEAKLADLGPDFDFVSARAGSQFFTSDFRGFIFSDTNRAVRLFGTQFSNRDQFNLIYFKQLEKDTNSDLNTFQDRHQDVIIANYYRQDFIWPGYTAQASFHYNRDGPTFHFDKNGFLVRPDPDGDFQAHRVEVAYLGWAGNGHIDSVNITHQLYWALGHDSRNPLANQPQDINAQMAAVELSYDRDWMRFRTSFLWASGDDNPNNSHATGFDAIIDNPNFAGGDFSFWQRQAIKLLGVNLVNRESLLPDLRSSKTEGQSNFVNPGLFLFNFGVDMDLTPKLKMVNNVNLLWFDETEVLEQFIFQETVHHFIGWDLSSGFEYRPLLSNNVITKFGVSSLIPGRGFSNIYSNFSGPTHPLLAGFLELTLTY